MDCKSKLGELGKMRVGMLKLGELSEVSFGILKLGKVSFRTLKMSWVNTQLGELWNIEVG